MIKSIISLKKAVRKFANFILPWNISRMERSFVASHRFEKKKNKGYKHLIIFVEKDSIKWGHIVGMKNLLRQSKQFTKAYL